jgi:prepilin-type N-terminal cleavage/methylation domain-containing protein
MKGERKQIGFTLVELLVVIAVISILLGILVPAVNMAKQYAMSTVCKTNLKAIGIAFRMYLDENGDVMPPASAMPSIMDETFEFKYGIAHFIVPFLSSEKSLKCPADRGADRTDDTHSYFETEGTSYEYNTRLGGKKIGVEGPTERHSEREIHVVRDFSYFHGKAPRPGEKVKPGAYNYLFVDTFIGDRERE